MQITIHVHQHDSDNAEILKLLRAILAQGENVAGELTALKAQVAKNTTVIGSALTLISGFKGLLDAAIASGNPADLVALSAQLGTDDDALAAAVAANTPAAPAP